MEITHKIAVVTGGGSGMGAETARYLSQRGAKVAIMDLDQQAGETCAAQINGLAFCCDVSDAKETEAALQAIKAAWGIPQICINCAGIAPARRIVNRYGPMALQDFANVIRVNVLGTFNVLRLVAAMMIENPSLNDAEENGVIINTASIAAFEGQVGQCAYSASKGAIVALTLPAARELAQYKIRVVTIAPGLIQTPLFEGFSQEVQDGLASNVPFPKRLGQPVEFAMLVAHIIENSYLNGEVIRLDGALRMPAK
jgi:NAD(P)-dependent dehydrogenase (short-subunit alcohol dehydrogenase family)